MIVIVGTVLALAGIVGWQRAKAHARAGTGPFARPRPPLVVDCSALHAANGRDWDLIAAAQDREDMPAMAATSRACAEESRRRAREAGARG